jgi:hypothetical protein
MECDVGFTKTKEPFAILTVSEMKKCVTATQLAVFSAIKSYSANGKKEVDLSLRDVTERCPVSYRTVARIVDELVGIGMIKITGSKKRRGGQSPIYKVCHIGTVGNKSVIPQHTKDKESVTLSPESVTLSPESVTPLGTKRRQIRNKKEGRKNINKKFLRNIPHLTLGEYVKDFAFSPETIKEEGLRAYDWLELKGKNYKNYNAFFRNWLRKKQEFDKEKSQLPKGEYQNEDLSWTLVHIKNGKRVEETISNKEYLKRGNQ